MNTHDVLSILVLVLTPLATMAAVGMQLRGQAERDLYTFRRQRLETRDATLRGAYVKVLRAADMLTDAVQDLGMYPRGRPHIARTEVTGPSTVGSERVFASSFEQQGDYARAQHFMDEAEKLISEARVDIGVERDDDECLDFYDEHFDRPFWGVYVEAISGSGPIPDFDKTIGQMRSDLKQVARLARQSRDAVLAAPPDAPRWGWLPSIRRSKLADPAKPQLPPPAPQ